MLVDRQLPRHSDVWTARVLLRYCRFASPRLERAFVSATVGESWGERERERERDPSLSSVHFALTPSHADRKKQTGDRKLVEDYWPFK